MLLEDNLLLQVNCSNNAFNALVSCRSFVSNPSVNQWLTSDNVFANGVYRHTCQETITVGYGLRKKLVDMKTGISGVFPAIGKVVRRQRRELYV
jgi:hypothetical protein